MGGRYTGLRQEQNALVSVLVLTLGFHCGITEPDKSDVTSMDCRNRGCFS